MMKKYMFWDGEKKGKENMVAKYTPLCDCLRLCFCRLFCCDTNLFCERKV